MNTWVQKMVFGATSRVTEISPVHGARLLDAIFLGIGGSGTFAALSERRNRKVMARVKRFRRFLVVSDVHLGDALLAQSTLIAIRDFFPDAEIDYVINRMVAPLIEGNPDATRIIPLFSNAQFPSVAEIAAVRDIVRAGQYDLIIMLCPFIRHGEVADPGQPLVGLLSHGATILRNESHPAVINHFSYQEYLFVRGVLGMAAQPVRGDAFKGIRTMYTDEAIEEGATFHRESAASSGAPLVMYNPDSASKYNMMPLVDQVPLLEQLAGRTSAATTILVGEGHAAAGIGNTLRDALPPALRSKVRVIPRTMSLAGYSALIDLADLFVTGDTGPLHLAASRRYSRSGAHQFRNRTAILSFFGATTPRMSGYDSFHEGYLDSNQDAPSWCYQAGSPCRNISCLNKMFKTCRSVRCFEHVDVNALADQVMSYHDERFGPAPAAGVREPLTPRAPSSNQ